jgi:nucleotide-binding universal stress UspA family protein
MNELIVCATDFSPEANSALEWAATMARRDGGQVDLVHVLPPGTEDKKLLVFDTEEFDAEQLRLATERLRDVARRAAGHYGVSVRPQVVRGQAHEAVLRHAREAEARMIVMGTGGLGFIDRLVLGSVAARTVRSADRPVVLIPRECAASVWAGGPGVTSLRPARVVAALGESDDDAVVRFAAGLRREAPCDVTFLHLYWPMGEYVRLGLQGRRDLFASDPDVVKNLEPALRSKIGGLPGSGAVDLEIRPAWGEPASNLLVAVEEREADLLVVGAHERHGAAAVLTSSIAQRLLRQARYVPIAVVPADAGGKPVAIPRLRTVLAVTDLSPFGNAAVAHAYALARGARGVVELCHVHERALASPSYAYDAPGAPIGDLELARLLKELRALVPSEAQSLGIATHVSVVDGGKPAEAIVQASERLDVDAIVLGSHGRGGLAHTVLGSVAADVVQRSRRPVYVIRSG